MHEWTVPKMNQHSGKRVSKTPNNSDLSLDRNNELSLKYKKRVVEFVGGELEKDEQDPFITDDY